MEAEEVLAPQFRPHHSALPEPGGWHAHLSLDFKWRLDFTDLRFAHAGPLRVQKPLYPDGRNCCHAVIVHPPGGIAGGDSLAIRVSVAENAHAVLTTPSATKWYGSASGALARQDIDISVEGSLEWLPSETIVFDQACSRSEIAISAGDQASMFGWDLLIFGRQGSGESFDCGRFEQTVRVDLSGQTVWVDRLLLKGSDPLFSAAIGLDGHHAAGTVWAISPAHLPWMDEVLESIRANVPDIAWTCLHPRLLIGREVGCPIQMRHHLQQAWRFIKQTCWRLPANDLRLWAT